MRCRSLGAVGGLFWAGLVGWGWGVRSFHPNVDLLSLDHLALRTFIINSSQAMWPFSSSTPKPSDSLSSSNDLLVTPPFAVAPTVSSSDPTLPANPLPATGRPPAPGLSSPTAELAAQDAEHRPTRADLGALSTFSQACQAQADPKVGSSLGASTTGVVVPLSKGSALVHLAL